jgi:hypothetical protein
VTLRRGRAGIGGATVAVYEDAFPIPASGKLKTTQCIAATPGDGWAAAFRSRPGRYALELEVLEDSDVLYAGQLAKRPKPR